MNKTSILRVGVSAILLAAVGYGATLHASDSLPAGPVAPAPLTATHAAAEDLDLVGVIGDVMVDGCTSDNARCSKAWKDLGELAAQRGGL